MSLLEPAWLVLVLPAAMALWWWPERSRLRTLLRAALVVVVVLAMARPMLRTTAAGGNLVVVADRSRSLPADADRLQTEIISRLQTSMGKHDQLAVISVAESAAVEQELRPPKEQAADATGHAQVGADRSELAAGLRLALSLLPAEQPGRLLLLSDGRWTGGDPALVAARAAARGVAVDSINLGRETTGDLRIERIEAPAAVYTGEAFLITAWLQAPLADEVSYLLRRGDQVVARGSQHLAGGRHRLLLRDRAVRPGTASYTLEISGVRTDPVPESNRGRFLVTAAGTPRLLQVSRRPQSGLARLLRQTGIALDLQEPAAVDWSIAGLAPYAAVVLEDVPAPAIGDRGLRTVAAWVRSGAGGLLVTGGRHSFGVGGYYRTAIDPLLPVSMELRQEHRKLALAVVVALDRSGSMAMPVSGGRSKMDLANLAAAELAGLLTPMDELGVVAVDSSAHIVAPLTAVEHPTSVSARIRSIAAAGGGIFVYEALSTAAGMLASARAGTRHILLFADAADAEEPGQYRRLLDRCQQAGISVSVVGLGTPTDVDAGLLREIAERGGGNCFFTDDARQLPRLFAQDTILVARSTLIEQPTGLRRGSGLATLCGSILPQPPSIGGYNLCYLRPGALLGLQSEDEYRAPVLAGWHVAEGRVACYTAEADGELSGEMAAWEHTGALLGSVARWVMGADQTLPPELLVTQETGRGVQRIRLHLDPTAPGTTVPARARVVVTRQLADGQVTTEEQELRWLSPSTMGADLPLTGASVSLATVHLQGMGRQVLAPVCLPLSPELTGEGTDGTATLEHLARLSGGTLRLRPTTVWHEMPRRRHQRELATPLLLLAIGLALAEVLERRTGLASHGSRALAGLLRRRRQQPATVDEEDRPTARQPIAEAAGREQRQQPPRAAAEPATPTPGGDNRTGILDALSAARSRARRQGR